VAKESQVASARQASLFLANQLGFERIIAYQIATSVSELAYNLFFHTSHGGTFTIQRIHRKSHKSQEIGIQIITKRRNDFHVDVQKNLFKNGKP
jgi:anti-sigma regulatory factor (Ser/Thr protein kinase)